MENDLRNLDAKTIKRLRVRQLIELRGWSPAEFGRQINRTSQYVWKILSGARGIGKTLDPILVKVFNLKSVQELYKLPDEFGIFAIAWNHLLDAHEMKPERFDMVLKLLKVILDNEQEDIAFTMINSLLDSLLKK